MRRGGLLVLGVENEYRCIVITSFRISNNGLAKQQSLRVRMRVVCSVDNTRNKIMSIKTRLGKRWHHMQIMRKTTSSLPPSITMTILPPIPPPLSSIPTLEFLFAQSLIHFIVSPTHPPFDTFSRFHRFFRWIHFHVFP